MIRYDSTFGRFQGELDTYENGLIIEGQKIPVFSESDAALIPWGHVVQSILLMQQVHTVQRKKAKAHLEGGAKKVIISAPAKNGDTPTFIMGINHDKYTSRLCQLYRMHHVLRIVSHQSVKFWKIIMESNMG